MDTYLRGQNSRPVRKTISLRSAGNESGETGQSKSNKW